MFHVTVSAPTNIAVIKYWGKADVPLNTPLNDSLSLTLDQTDLKAVTTVAASDKFATNRLWINGNEVQPNSRFDTVLDQMKSLAQDVQAMKVSFGNKDQGSKSQTQLVSASDWKRMKVHVSSYNTFPTAAGLASSAAGYAALVTGLANLYNAKEEFDGHFTAIARQGSGSACRSLYGGFVAWRKGTSGDAKQLDTTSIAEPVASEAHWPLCAIILVVSSQPKHTSSTHGMQTSVATSTLISHRASEVVPQRMKEMEKAILERDFDSFATLTMQDSNQFHAICLDTYPPICYLNDTSRSIIQLVTEYNRNVGETRCAYTFDAGPNAVLYFQQQHLLEVSALVARAFGLSLFLPSREARSSLSILQSDIESCRNAALEKVTFLGGVERIYITKVGPGPQVVTDACNVDAATGLNVFRAIDS